MAVNLFSNYIVYQLDGAKKKLVKKQQLEVDKLNDKLTLGALCSSCQSKLMLLSAEGIYCNSWECLLTDTRLVCCMLLYFTPLMIPAVWQGNYSLIYIHVIYSVFVLKFISIGYLLPIINKLLVDKEAVSKPPYAIVLLPSIELCNQVSSGHATVNYEHLKYFWNIAT